MTSSLDARRMPASAASPAAAATAASPASPSSPASPASPASPSSPSSPAPLAAVRACVFPGQGSQSAGMGAGLFERYPRETAAADEVLGYSIAELCLANPGGRLDQTRYTQPALFVVNALAYRRRQDEGLPPPAFLAGHSLGEYCALWAAGVFDFTAGLRLVQRRGELMSEAAAGGMAAVIGCDASLVAATLAEHRLAGIDVANYNTPNQVVLAGPADEIARAEDVFSALGATYIPLKNVAAAFHSRYMEGLVQPMAEALAGVELRPPKIPVIANVTALPYSASTARELLLRQLREPVRWADGIGYLLAAGVGEFEEVGPGQVLTKLVKSIRRQSAAGRPEAGGGKDGRQVRSGARLGALDASRVPAGLRAEDLGAASFRRDYDVRRAYAAGSQGPGVVARDLVIRLAKAGYLAFLTAGGGAEPLEESLAAIRQALGAGPSFGVTLRPRVDDPEAEMATVAACLRHGVRAVEAAGHVALSPALVRYRLQGLSRGEQGRPLCAHKVLARVARPDVAEIFLRPPGEGMVAELLQAGMISREEADLSRWVPMADDLCLEADGNAELGGLAVELPALHRRRDEACRRAAAAAFAACDSVVRVGAAGGVGTPEAAAMAFLFGADFVRTGSLNQCTVEGSTSEAVKDLLQGIDIDATEHAPTGDLFELGGKAQVLKKGVLFPARAARLYDLWRHHAAWDEIAAPARARIERDYFGRTFGQVFAAALEDYRAVPAADRAAAERDGRLKMALVFRWYFDHSLHLARAGVPGQSANYQVPCGPELGAFNQWAKGTPLESWRQRHADQVADAIMEGAAEVLAARLQRLAAARPLPEAANP